jgi:hypothetical protein
MNDESSQEQPAPGQAAAVAQIETALANSEERELLVWHYALGRLPAEQVQVFEERFLRDHALLDQIQAAELFVDDYRRLDDRGHLQRLPAPRSAWRPAYVVAAALASAVAAVAIAIYAYASAQQLRHELAQVYAPQANTQVIDLEVTRGASPGAAQPLALRLPAHPGWIVLAMDAGAAAGATRHARLLKSNQVVAESDDLQPDDLGVVYWSIHSSWLHEGDYEAELSADGAAAPSARYALRVSSKG